MQLYFPNRETLRAALTSGAVTRTVASAPAEAAFGSGGELWIKPAKPVSKTRLTQLEQLGASRAEGSRSYTVQASCWQQVLPAQPSSRAAQYDAGAFVLFDLHGQQQFNDFVTEMLRLDNDRQSYRVLNQNGAMRTLLHVKGPPYYTLLRAIDQTRPAGNELQPTAYREQSAGVWVQWGYKHPLASTITPPAGQILLIGAPHRWTYLEEGVFQDIYQAVKIQLPNQPSTLKPAALDARIQVPLTVTPSGSSDPPRLWVLGDGGFEQLDQFVRTADKRLIDRLSFAVGQSAAAGGKMGSAADNPQRTIVLRVRASNQPPPVIVLPGAIACRNYLKKPNLFLPCNLRLHPPVNPKVVNRLLAPDPTQIVWLKEDAETGFQVESLPDVAFQPLHKWVDYVLQQNVKPLEAWVAAHQFEFEPFVCREDQFDRAKKPPPRKTAGKKRTREAAPLPEDEPPAGSQPAARKKPGAPELFTPASRPELGELEKRINALQAEFRASEEPLDSPHRSQQWLHMGSLYAALGVNRHDCSICWVNGLWESSTADQAMIAAWLEAEKPGASRKPLTGEQLDALTPETSSGPAELSGLAAYLLWASVQNPPPEEVVSRLQRISRFLEQHERDVPVRTAWLAWSAVVAMSSGDELALARARDRLLGRLHQQGLQPNLDMAGFLRTSSESDAGRMAAAQQQLPVIHRKAVEWVKASVKRSDAPAETARLTAPHVDLMFAFGYARNGDLKASNTARQNAARELENSSELHEWCRDVFSYRIREAIDSRPPAALDESLQKRLAVLQKGEFAYAIDKYRERSRVLHDQQKINEYVHSVVVVDELELEFIRLAKVSDTQEIRNGILQLISRVDRGRDKLELRASIVAGALEFAPRTGDAVGRELLSRACDLLENKQLPLHSRAALLEKGVLVAAHFDQVEYVRVFVNQLEETAPALIAGFFAPLTTGATVGENNLAFVVDSLFKECLRGMRKMGLRTETSSLLKKLHQALEAQPRSRKKNTRKNLPAGQMDMQWSKLQLHVAAGYFYFRREDEALKLIDQVRDELFNNSFIPNTIFKTRVVCGYIEALAQAPPEIAAPRIEEIFNSSSDKPRLTSVFDNRANATMSLLAIAPLQVVEAAVFALCGEDPGLTRESRRWLDEDEFLVRRRIHHDVRTLHREE